MIALARVGLRSGDTVRLKEAVTAFRAALEELTRERVLLAWARTQNNLGRTLLALGQRLESAEHLHAAPAAFSAARDA